MALLLARMREQAEIEGAFEFLGSIACLAQHHGLTGGARWPSRLRLETMQREEAMKRGYRPCYLSIGFTWNAVQRVPWSSVFSQ